MEGTEYKKLDQSLSAQHPKPASVYAAFLLFLLSILSPYLIMSVCLHELLIYSYCDTIQRLHAITGQTPANLVLCIGTEN